MSEDAIYKAAALKVVISASTSLAVMLLDFGLLMHDEVKYIWSRLRTSWSARLYVSTRSIGMISQIFNVYFSVRMYLGIYTSPTGCRIWFSYQALIIQSLLACVEGLLMHRLYALFLKSRMVLLMLIVFVLAQMASMGVSARLSFPSNKYTVSCWMVKANPGNAFFSATTMTTNVVIFFMTFLRYFRLPTKWTREGLGRIVIRDSAISLAAISVIMLFLTLCSLEVIKPSMSGNITFCWLVCTLWISIGRIIVNHEKIPRDEQGGSNTWRGTVQLTSQIEMGESMSTLTLDSQCESSTGPTASTLQASLSTPMTKASQLSPSSVCTSNAAREWYGDIPLPHEHVRRKSPQPPSAASIEVGGASQTEGHPRVDGDVHEHGRSPSSSSQPASVKASAPNENQLSPSSGRTSDGDASQTGDYQQADAEIHEHGHSPSSSPQPSDIASVEVSVCNTNQLSPSTGHTRDGDASQTEDRQQADADAHEHGYDSPSSSPQSSSSELPPLGVLS